MIALVPLDAMQRQVVFAAEGGHVCELFRLLGNSQSAPGTIAQVKHAVIVSHPVDERLGALEGVVVVLEHDRYAVFFEERYPEFAVLLAGTGRGGSCGGHFGGHVPIRRIRRDVIDDHHVGVVFAGLQGFGEPGGLIAADR